MMFNTLLYLHILCGFASLITAVFAMSTKKGGNMHRQTGRYFFYGMTGVFITALPMSFMNSDTFLFLIALFSYYLAYSSWRYSKMKNNTPHVSDIVIAYLMLAIAVGMIVLGFWKFDTNKFEDVLLVIFGSLSGLLAFEDIKTFRTGISSTKMPISKHLGAMIGATIAASTVFAVVNISLQSEIIVWLAPTVIFTPLIFYWNKKMLKKS